MSAYRLTTKPDGFTLIELLVVIAIIAILSVVGIAAFKGVTGGARDSTRRADIDAIAKAYEIQKTSGYIVLSDSQFASGKKPQDPNSQKGDYFNWLATDGSGFKVCASLEANPASACNTPAINCYCKFSSQGTLNPSSPVNQGASTNYLSGLGGSSSSSCDPNGTLLSGLVGYWKMDEIASPFLDYSGNNNSGIWVGGVGIAPGVRVSPYDFKNAGNFDGSNDYVDAGAMDMIEGINSFTVEAWIKLNVLWSAMLPSYPGFIGKQGAWRIYGSMADNIISFYVDGTTTGRHNVNTNVASVADVWYHIVGTYDGSTQKLFVNGVQQAATASWTDTLISTASTLDMGRGDSGYFNGLIDDVRIYNRALSSPEILALWNGGNGCI